MDLSNENIVHVKGGNIEYLQFRKLLKYKEIIHCYTLSKNNIDFKNEYSSSVEKLCNTLNIDKVSIVRPEQKHTDVVKCISKKEEDLKNVDGLITNSKGINMVLSFADCTPILIYDPIKKVIANVHSGWKGTAQKIGQKAAIKMKEEYGCRMQDLIVCIGPAIQKCHFEVEEDVKEIFYNNFKYLNNCNIIEKSKQKENKYFIDTTLINRLILEEVGVKKENIIESNICTACNMKFMHSYRVNGEKAGRNICMMGLKNKE